jgi:hypothetical protein
MASPWYNPGMLIMVLIGLHIIFLPYSLYSVFVAFTGGTDAGFILLFTWPLILGSVAILTLDGILMLRAAMWPRKPMPKQKRIMLGIVGILPLLPILGIVASLCSHLFLLMSYH